MIRPHLRTAGVGAALCLSLTAAILVPHVWAGSSPTQIAPLNPAFLDYLNSQGTAVSGSQGTTPLLMAPSNPTEHPLGYIPAPIAPKTHVAPQLLTATALPATYDMRDPNGTGNPSESLLPPVEDQGTCGDCWTFGTYGSLTSQLKKFYGLNQDFSEDNLKHRHGFDAGPCDGGDYYMSGAYLSRYDGPISETDDPYSQAPNSAFCSTCTPRRYVDGMVFLPVKSSVLDNGYIKQAILDHGGILTSMQWVDSSFNSADNTYYYKDPNGQHPADHSVVIVGWDDTKAVAGAPGKGAFIIRNSWGSNWGDGGYFYASYYDSSIGWSDVVYFNAKRLTTYDKVYYYDTLGPTNVVGFKSDTAWAANVFTAGEDASLQAVNFYMSNGGTYTVQVYGDFSGSSFSNLLTTATGTVANEGWYTVTLPKKIAIAKNQHFGIVVKFTTPGYQYPIGVEAAYPNYSSKAIVNPGESYTSTDGKVWNDVVSDASINGNVCIKALVKIEPTVSLRTANVTISSTGTTPGRFVVSRTGSKNTPLRVYYTVGGTAVNGVAYQKISGVVTIPIGVSTASIPIKPISGGVAGVSKTVKITLTNNAAYTVGASSTGMLSITAN